MPQPQPKSELVATILDRVAIKVVTVSDSAREWVKREAPRYGTLISLSSDGSVAMLHVHTSMWDIDEVCAYLNEWSN